MKIKSANGIEGCLIYSSLLGKYYFRVHDENREFKDYDICHLDLFVKINDADATFYEQDDGSLTIDYSPKTLGLGDDND
jgi:hypothetical protein